MDILLDAVWTKRAHTKVYHLEVFIVGKWRPVYIQAKSPRKLTKKDLNRVKEIVAMNTSGEMNVIGLVLV